MCRSLSPFLTVSSHSPRVIPAVSSCLPTEMRPHEASICAMEATISPSLTRWTSNFSVRYTPRAHGVSLPRPTIVRDINTRVRSISAIRTPELETRDWQTIARPRASNCNGATVRMPRQTLTAVSLPASTLPHHPTRSIICRRSTTLLTVRRARAHRPYHGAQASPVSDSISLLLPICRRICVTPASP